MDCPLKFSSSQNDFSNRIKKAGMPKLLVTSTAQPTTSLVTVSQPQMIGATPAPSTTVAALNKKPDVAIPVKASKPSIAFDINDPQDPPLPDGTTKKAEKGKKGGLQVGLVRTVFLFF